MSKSELGQFFTKNETIQNIFGKLHDENKGLILEPSFGEGDLIKSIKNYEYLFGIEYDNKIYRKYDAFSLFKENCAIINGCFFDTLSYWKNYNFNSIISNPPYVASNKYKMSKCMKKFAEDNNFKGNFNILYLFILKAAQIVQDDGEILFIVPKDFTYSTYARPLREYLRTGSFTHWIDCGEEKIFDDANLESTVIFRWVKKVEEKTLFVKNLTDFNENKIDQRNTVYFGDNLTILFSNDNMDDYVPVSKYFDVKVGSVSGCDGVFKVDNNSDLSKLSCAKKFVSGRDGEEILLDTNDFKDIDDMPNKLKKYLIKNKKLLINRYGIDKSNWWRWSFLRNSNVSMNKTNKDRIFVSAKTRKVPFWIGKKYGFIGSVYGLFPKNDNLNLNNVVEYLNGEECQNLLSSCGIKTNNKFKATPKAISDIPIPKILLEKDDDVE
jgi:adenine-specific DNA-methyltransferase